MTKQLQVLTSQESAFAAEHHDYIFNFLDSNGLPENDYYDVAVFGYLKAVCRHFREINTPEFKLLADAEMLSACNEFDDELEENPVYSGSSLNIDIGRPIEDVIADVKDTAQDAISAISIEKTLACFDDTEKRIVNLLMMNYPKTDIAGMLDMSVTTLFERISVIQQKTYDTPLMMAA